MPSFCRHPRTLIALLAVLAMPAGCGNKGPLYLPDAEPVMPAPPAGADGPDDNASSPPTL